MIQILFYNWKIQIKQAVKSLFNKPFTRANIGTVYPLVSVVLRFEIGVFSGIFFENLENACPGKAKSEQLLENNKWENQIKNQTNNSSISNNFCPRIICNQTETDLGFCDLKLFVFFSGTDARGNKLASIDKRFTNMRNQQLAAVFASFGLLDNQVDLQLEPIIKMKDEVFKRLNNTNKTSQQFTPLSKNTTTV